MNRDYNRLHSKILRLIEEGDIGEGVDYFLENRDLYEDSGNSLRGRISIIESINQSIDYPEFNLRLTRRTSILEMDKFLESLCDCCIYR